MSDGSGAGTRHPTADRLKILRVVLRVAAGSSSDDGPPATNPNRTPIRATRRGTHTTMALPTLTAAQRDEALRQAQAVIRS
jgi:hypothetical protein